MHQSLLGSGLQVVLVKKQQSKGCQLPDFCRQASFNIIVGKRQIAKIVKKTNLSWQCSIESVTAERQPAGVRMGKEEFPRNETANVIIGHVHKDDITSSSKVLWRGSVPGW